MDTDKKIAEDEILVETAVQPKEAKVPAKKKSVDAEEKETKSGKKSKEKSVKKSSKKVRNETNKLESTEVNEEAPKKLKNTKANEEAPKKLKRTEVKEGSPKRPSRKREIQGKVIFQVAGLEIEPQEILERVKEEGKARFSDSNLLTVELYIKPEDKKAYYIFNGDPKLKGEVLL